MPDVTPTDAWPKWIDFVRSGTSPTGKTDLWIVATKESGTPLGRIEWYGPWRKYVFCPNGMTVYEWQCLRDIAEFCERATAEHKQRKAV